MTPSRRNILCGFALLMSASIACDEGPADGPEGPVVERDGAVAQFKTQSVDQTFKWKGCEPPWGPWPYAVRTPTEAWRGDVAEHIAPDVAAHVLGAWLDVGGGRSCDQGCASLALRWTGEARAVEIRHEVDSAVAVGRCEGDDFAYSVDVAANAAFECTCG